MYFSSQALVLAALALETAIAQPHRHMHQHQARALSDVLGTRDSTDWSAVSTYKNPKTGQPFTTAEWACFSEGKSDAECFGDSGDAPAASAAPAPAAAAPEEKVAEPASHAAAPSPKQSASSGSDSDSGPGAHIFNKGSTTQTYAFYANNPYGQATSPDDDKTITLTPGSDKFVPLDLSWKGHVQRAQSNQHVSSAATWAEIQVQAAGGNEAWGDISLQKGCDGAAMIISPQEGSQYGFTKDIISSAPAAAKVKTFDGQDALGYTEPGYMGAINEVRNQAAVDWENSEVGQDQVYIVGGSGTNVVHSSTNILHVEFY